MFIKRISPSKLKVYDTCKLQYKLKYIDFLPEEYNSTQNTDALEYGKYIHKIFEDGMGETDVKKLQEIADKVKPNYRVTPEKDKNTEASIKNFAKLNEKLATACEDVSAEKSFAIEIKDNYAINGVIDRIVKNQDGEYLVIDYKTSKRAVKKTDLYTDEQMIMYAFAVSYLYKVPIEKIRLAHYYPHLDKLVDIRYERGKINNFMRKLTDKVWKIRKAKKDDFFAEPNRLCRFCGFYDICPKGLGSDRVLKETLEDPEVIEAIAKRRAEAKAYNKQFNV